MIWKYEKPTSVVDTGVEEKAKSALQKRYFVKCDDKEAMSKVHWTKSCLKIKRKNI